jgi:cobalamin biosynthesis protein CobD/CbiB
MEWWYRLYGWSHTRPLAPLRVLLVTAPVYWTGQLIPIVLGRMTNSLVPQQDILAGFFLGFTMVIIFETLLTLGAPRYAALKAREAQGDRT